MDILYTAEALATGGGRNGHVRTTDGILDTDVRVPKEMGGAGGAPNPELLFAAGYAACFHSALQSVARAQKVVSRSRSHGVAVDLPSEPIGAEEVGRGIVELVARAQANGIDADAAARDAVRALESRIRDAEAS